MRRTLRINYLMSVVLLTFLFPGCQSDDQSQTGQKTANTGTQTTASGGLSEFETEHGIGPIKTEIELGEVDTALAEKGKPLFESKCTACHKMEERYVGPPLGDVLSKRSPAYVMNMILNPQEMTQKHPEARTLLAEYMTIMPFQNVSEEDARAMLEYIHSAQSGK